MKAQGYFLSVFVPGKGADSMEIDIINQYMDAAAGIRRLKKEIGILEERLLKAMDKEHGVVSDIVSRGRRGKKSLGSVKFS